MRFDFRGRLVAVAAVCVVALVLASSRTTAKHAWGNYHWARSANPVQLAVGDNLTADWYGYLVTAVNDWNWSAVLDLSIVPGGTRPRQCKPTAGRIEVCNESYGNNGWLGIAQIWASGDHITQAVMKLNDFYFAWPSYNTPEWKQFVMCQELGHDFGLDHQDENFENGNLGSWMDYTNNPGGPPDNLAPNAHDFEQLAALYAHTDGGSGGGGGGGGGRGRGAGAGVSPQRPDPAHEQGPGDDPSAWGQLMRADGRSALFQLDLGNGRRIFTFVIWA